LADTKKIYALFLKDVKSELRTKFVVTTLLLFILTSVSMFLFGTAGERINNGIASGFIWIIMFFSAMTGLSKSFVAEEERQTILFLKLIVKPLVVYFGKLVFNVILNLLLNTLAVILIFLFIDSVTIKSWDIFIINHILASVGIAAASTIISAIITKASARGAIYPVLSFPVLIPLIIPGIENTTMALEGAPLGDAMGNLQIMFAFCGLIISISFVLFDFVWEE
jgi:heme exporter protein B